MPLVKAPVSRYPAAFSIVSNASLAESEHAEQGHENRGVEIGREAVDDDHGGRPGGETAQRQAPHHALSLIHI